MPYKDPDRQREYHREYMRGWYTRNKELHLQRVHRATAKRRAMLLERINELKDRPCADCGIRYPPFMTDFDHVSDDKVDAICNLRRRTANWSKILAEMEKCDLVCANCHRARTHYGRLGQVPPMAILAQALGQCMVIAVPE